MQESLNVLAAHCQAVGRDPASIATTFSTDCVAVAGSSQEAQRMAQSSPFYNGAAGLIGTPDEVTAKMQRYIDLGVQHFMLRFVDFPRFDGAALFVKEVLPRFREMR